MPPFFFASVFARYRGLYRFLRVWHLASAFTSLLREPTIVGRALSGIRNAHPRNKKSYPPRMTRGGIHNHTHDLKTEQNAHLYFTTLSPQHFARTSFFRAHITSSSVFRVFLLFFFVCLVHRWLLSLSSLSWYRAFLSFSRRCD